MTENQLKEIVENIKEAADELNEKGRENMDIFEKGQLIAYAEALTIIHDAVSETDLKTIGLDFDIEKKYLY